MESDEIRLDQSIADDKIIKRTELSVMAESTNLLMLEFLTWVADRRRTYDEAMAAWQSHCPRQTIWEDAIIDGLIQLERDELPHNPEVALTSRGRALLNDNNGPH